MKKILILLLCTVLCGCSASLQASAPSPSRKQQGWGFRRTENGPEFTSYQIDTMKKYNCIFREETKEKNIYLTFDEGYENGYTSVILDVLREKGVKAAFFVTAPYVKQNPDLIKRMAQEGHIIGNHTVNHPSLPSLKDEEAFQKELTELDRLIFGICGTFSEFLRPPKGEYSEYSLSVSTQMGYTNVFWSDAYVDWNTNTTATEAHNQIIKNLHCGEVLLLHAVSKGNSDALGDIIDTAREKGFVFKALDKYPKH